MDALSRSGWMDTVSTSGGMDALSRGDWMDAFSWGGGWIR